MLPKIPYSMEKNKSAAVPIGNYNVSSNFNPGDIADSYGISARKFPCLTNRRGRELYMDVYGIHEEVPSGLVGMAVFNGEIVTVITNVDTAIYVEGEKIYDGLNHSFDTRQLVPINSKLVVYPDKVYIEKVDGEWVVDTLHETVDGYDVTFNNDNLVFSESGNKISGYGVMLSGTNLRFPVREIIDHKTRDYQISWDSEKKRNIVTYMGQKYSATIKHDDNEIYFIEIGSANMPNTICLTVFVYINSNKRYYKGRVAGFESMDKGVGIFVTFSTDIEGVPLGATISCAVYWPGDEGSPFENIVDGTWLEIAGFKDAFERDGDYALSASTHSSPFSSYGTSNIVKLAWSLDDLQKIKVGDAIELSELEGEILTVKEVPDIDIDNNYESITITLNENAISTLDTLDKVTVKYSSDRRVFPFNNGDAVTISGCKNTSNNKTFVISKSGIGTIFASAEIFEPGTEEQITIERKVPDLDFICERDNRLYGVNNAEKTVYVSALGDPTNMYAYEGVATDSFAVPVGGEGDFTGCCKYGESVLFFKEDKIYKLTGYTPADFAIDSYDVDGLETGAYKSCVVINEVLYYKGKNGVFAYTGGIPTLISEGFGETVFKGGSAGTDGISYYLSTEKGGKTHLFVYNTRLGLWTREGDERYYTFVRKSDGLYAADNGGIDKLNADAIDSEWMVQFVPFYETIEGKKTYSRLLMRAELPRGSYMIIEVRSDDGVWREAGKIVGANKGIIPIRLPIARCDKFEIRLRGKGEFTIHDILREYHVGSEV